MSARRSRAGPSVPNSAFARCTVALGRRLSQHTACLCGGGAVAHHKSSPNGLVLERHPNAAGFIHRRGGFSATSIEMAFRLLGRLATYQWAFLRGLDFDLQHRPTGGSRRFDCGSQSPDASRQSRSCRDPLDLDRIAETCCRPCPLPCGSTHASGCWRCVLAADFRRGGLAARCASMAPERRLGSRAPFPRSGTPTRSNGRPRRLSPGHHSGS